jgi:hypothetical protein
MQPEKGAQRTPSLKGYERLQGHRNHEANRAATCPVVGCRFPPSPSIADVSVSLGAVAKRDRLPNEAQRFRLNLNVHSKQAAAMPTWILRKSVDDERVGKPRPCAARDEIARAVGILTVREQMASMLAAGEYTARCAEARHEIYDGHGLVGYFVLLSNESL